MREEFDTATLVAITKRATSADGRTYCEQCGVWVKSRAHYEIHHILPEGMRSAADRKRKLMAADGRLLCKAVCHAKQTRYDKSAIALAKRQEAYHLGVERPGKRKIPRKRKRERGEPKRCAGAPALMRRGFAPAGRNP
jgi:hypothetical protein